MMTCAKCGASLDHMRDVPLEERAPCPGCGSFARNLSVSFDLGVSVRDDLAYLHEREAQAIGFGETPRDGRAATADLTSSKLRFSLSGTSPQGEEDTLRACRVLVQRLNQEGQEWGEPEPSFGGIDALIPHGSVSGRTLSVQVTHALVDQTFWQAVSVSGRASREQSLDEAASIVKEAIGSKAIEWKIPTRDRAEIVLLLDATRLPGIAFDAVVERFALLHGDWARELSFAAIWLVGPMPRLVWRLDAGDTRGAGRVEDQRGGGRVGE